MFGTLYEQFAQEVPVSDDPVGESGGVMRVASMICGP